MDFKTEEWDQNTGLVIVEDFNWKIGTGRHDWNKDKDVVGFEQKWNLGNMNDKGNEPCVMDVYKCHD